MKHCFIKTGAPLHTPGTMDLQQDQGQQAGHEHRQHERRAQLQVREEGADQAGSGHVQRWADVQDVGVHAQAKPLSFATSEYKTFKFGAVTYSRGEHSNTPTNFL
jgi:hypothetical protein